MVPFTLSDRPAHRGALGSLSLEASPVTPIELVLRAVNGQPIDVPVAEIPAAIAVLEDARAIGQCAGVTAHQQETLDTAIAALRTRLAHG
jgi:hypothetical protein